MIRYMTASERIRIISDLLQDFPKTEDPDTKEVYTEIPFEELTRRGLPKSALSPGYWSGLSTGLKTAVQLGKRVKFSEKYQCIRFYVLRPEDKLIINDRKARYAGQSRNSDGGKINSDTRPVMNKLREREREILSRPIVEDPDQHIIFDEDNEMIDNTNNNNSED